MDFETTELVNHYKLYIDTCSLMNEEASDYFYIELSSALKAAGKKLYLLSNVFGELLGLSKDENRRKAAVNGLKIITAYESLGLMERVNVPEKTPADRAFLHTFLDERLHNNVCLITEDRRLAKDIIINLKNLDSTPAMYDVVALRLQGGEARFWDISQIESQLGLSEIDDYRLMNENNNHKLLIGLVVDNSASMAGEKMTLLGKALIEFTSRLSQKDVERNVEYAINIFEGFETRQLKGFKDAQFNPSYLVAGRMPFLGQSIEKSIEALSSRIQELRNMGHKLYKPWLVVLTDGQSFDTTKEAMETIHAMADNGDLQYLPFKLSDSPSSKEIETLMAYKGKRPLEIIDKKYKEMFDWLYLSLAKRLATPIEQKFQTEKDQLKGWSK